MAKSTIKSNVKTETKAIAKPIVNEVVEAWKQAFQDAFDRELRISDELIQQIIDRAGDAWETWEDQQKLDFLETAEKEAAKVHVADPTIARLVAKLEADEHAMKEVTDNLTAAMRTKINRPIMYAEFKRIYTKEELDGMPYPGSDEDDVKGTNYKPDKTKEKDSANNTFTQVWTDEFVFRMALGKNLEDRIEDLKKEGTAKNSSQWYKGYSKQDRGQEAAALRSELSALRSMVRGAIQIHHAFSGIQSMPLVNIRWCRTRNEKKFIPIPEKEGKAQPVLQVTTSPKNIWLEAAGEPESGDVYTVSQLISYDIPAAIRNGGTLAALKETAAKAEPGKKKESEFGDGSDMSKDQAYTIGNLFVNYIEKTANDAQLQLVFADPKAEHHEDWLENFVSIRSWVYRMEKKFKKQIEAATKAKLDALTEEAA